jgi:thiol:disulfide interchange protein DsbD
MAGGLASQEKEPVAVTAEVSPAALQWYEKGTLAVTCDIAGGYHISDATSSYFQVIPADLPGISFDEPEYPQGEKEEFVGFVYRGRITVNVPFRVGKEAGEGTRILPVEVTVQSCAEASGICYAPETREVEAHFTVLAITDKEEPVSTESSGIAGRLSRSLDQGSWVAFFIVFLGGLLTSFTPCVYPMIPITIAVIGAQAGDGKLRGFVLSLFYVLGICVTFSTLGIIAAKTGGLFGSYVQHPVVVVLISMIFLLMGLSMLGVFVLRMPSSLATKLQGKRRTGFIGALLTGLVAGLVVSPCVSPLLVVILAWVARTGSVILGIGLLFSFALGLGVLFIVLGTFSGVIKSLPKSGGWMEIIERGFGVLLVAIAIIFIRPILPAYIYHALWAIFLLVFGTFVGAFTPLDAEAGRQRKLGKAVGILSVLIGGALIFWTVYDWIGFRARPMENVRIQEREDARWLSSDEEGFRQAQLSGKPVIVDFWAEWCAACHELDEKTWPDPSVQMELDRFILVKLDLTRNNEQTKTYQKKYKIIGMPTVIFFDPSGEELGRFEGFRSPEDTIEILKQYK